VRIDVLSDELLPFRAVALETHFLGLMEGLVAGHALFDFHVHPHHRSGPLAALAVGEQRLVSLPSVRKFTTDWNPC